jgi:hypothetical protein
MFLYSGPMHRHRNDSYVTAVTPLFRTTGIQIKCHTHTHTHTRARAHTHIQISAVRHQQFDRLSHDSALNLYTSASDNSFLQLRSLNHGKQ